MLRPKRGRVLRGQAAPLIANLVHLGGAERLDWPAGPGFPRKEQPVLAEFWLTPTAPRTSRSGGATLLLPCDTAAVDAGVVASQLDGIMTAMSSAAFEMELSSLALADRPWLKEHGVVRVCEMSG